MARRPTREPRPDTHRRAAVRKPHGRRRARLPGLRPRRRNRHCARADRRNDLRVDRVSSAGRRRVSRSRSPTSAASLASTSSCRARCGSIGHASASRRGSCASPTASRSGRRRIDRELTNVLGVQRELSTAIAEQIRMRLSPEVRRGHRPAPDAEPDGVRALSEGPLRVEQAHPRRDAAGAGIFRAGHAG